MNEPKSACLLVFLTLSHSPTPSPSRALQNSFAQVASKVCVSKRGHKTTIARVAWRVSEVDACPSQKCENDASMVVVFLFRD